LTPQSLKVTDKTPDPYACATAIRDRRKRMEVGEVGANRSRRF
jgi:hypothetical protein